MDYNPPNAYLIENGSEPNVYIGPVDQSETLMLKYCMFGYSADLPRFNRDTAYQWILPHRVSNCIHHWKHLKGILTVKRKLIPRWRCASDVPRYYWIVKLETDEPEGVPRTMAIMESESYYDTYIPPF
jgi:hypothetical protein